MITDNVPVQKWVNLIISVYGRSLDVYIDGKLAKTCLLPGVANVNNKSDIYVNPTAFDNSTRTTAYDDDIAYLRGVLASVAYSIKGTAFRINTGPNDYVGFRGLTQATFVNTGSYVVPNNINDYYSINFNCNLDAIAAGSPLYYRDHIVASLSALGVVLPVCP
jgi:hypothetical protein